MKITFFDFKLFDLPEAAAAAGRCRGKNRRGILILMEASGQELSELEGFLGRILSAARLDLEEDITRLVLAPGERLPLSGLRAQVPFSTVLSFGVDPKRLGLHLPLARYQATRHAGITYLFADQLSAIQEERQRGGREMAGALWAALQEIFLTAE